jgi:hypothetical protein
LIRNHLAVIASQINVQLSHVTVVEGQRLGCCDAHLLKIYADGQQINVLLYQSELDELQSNIVSDRLEQRIRSSLSRLQMVPPLNKIPSS